MNHGIFLKNVLFSKECSNCHSRWNIVKTCPFCKNQICEKCIDEHIALSFYFPGDCQNLFIQTPIPLSICFHCGKGIFSSLGQHIIQCGPCGNHFHAGNCWESHRWSHGTSPALGIEYKANGKIIGYFE